LAWSAAKTSRSLAFLRAAGHGPAVRGLEVSFLTLAATRLGWTVWTGAGHRGLGRLASGLLAFLLIRNSQPRFLPILRGFTLGLDGNRQSPIANRQSPIANSAVPAGLGGFSAIQPHDESRCYYRSSLRDLNGQSPIDRVGNCHVSGFGTG
jgi:hypothetical protein